MYVVDGDSRWGDDDDTYGKIDTWGWGDGRDGNHHRRRMPPNRLLLRHMRMYLIFLSLLFNISGEPWFRSSPSCFPARRPAVIWGSNSFSAITIYVPISCTYTIWWRNRIYQHQAARIEAWIDQRRYCSCSYIIASTYTVCVRTYAHPNHCVSRSISIHLNTSTRMHLYWGVRDEHDDAHAHAHAASTISISIRITSHCVHRCPRYILIRRSSKLDGIASIDRRWYLLEEGRERIRDPGQMGLGSPRSAGS